MPVVKRDSHHHTYADYLIWSNTYGNELIDGTAYVREPPSPTRSHQAILVELSRQIANALKDKPYKVYSAPFDVRLPKSNEADDEIDTVVQPDLLIVADLKKLDERGVRGAPDWLAEILHQAHTENPQTRIGPLQPRSRAQAPRPNPTHRHSRRHNRLEPSTRRALAASAMAAPRIDVYHSGVTREPRHGAG